MGKQCRGEGAKGGPGIPPPRGRRVQGRSPALPTLRPACRPHPAHLLESFRPAYPLTTGYSFTSGRPHISWQALSRPSPSGAPSPSSSHPRVPPNSPHLRADPRPSTSEPPKPRAPSPRGAPAADSGQSTRRTGSGTRSHFLVGVGRGFAASAPRGWGRGPGTVRKPKAPPILPGFRAARTQGAQKSSTIAPHYFMNG